MCSICSDFLCFGCMKVITADELMDDGEYEEILEDMKDEGGKFGMHTILFQSDILCIRTTSYFQVVY